MSSNSSSIPIPGSVIPFQSIPSWSRPHVLILSSPSCQSIFAKNHLTPAEYFKPFGYSLAQNPSLGPCYFRTPTRGGYQLQKFGLEFISSSECTSMPGPLAEDYLNCILAMNTPPAHRLVDGVKDQRDCASFFKHNPDPTPWFNSYKSHFCSTLRFHPHESIDQPVHILFLIAGSESQPAALVESMRNIENLPPSYKKGIFDPATPRSIVVVHDKHWDLSDSTALDRTLQAMKSLKQVYGPETVMRLLEINSLAQPNLKQTDIWAPHLSRGRVMAKFSGGMEENNENNSVDGSSDSASLRLSLPLFDALFSIPPSESRGQFFSSGDLDLTNSLISELLTKQILPPIERKISQLTEKVTAMRKGFKNAMKSLFGRREKPAATLQRIPSGSQSASLYPFDSPESQTRQLADLSFLFQDYELSAAHYRMCVSDAKNEKLYLNYSLAQEMLGLCIGLNNNDNNQYREMKECLESACNSYIQIGANRQATRSALFAIELYRQHSYSSTRLADSLSALLRVSERENETSRTPVLLEQVAYAFLGCSTPPLVRKYAFHLVQAGHGYHRFGLISHGLRTYSSAQYVYNSLGWNSMEQRLFHSLGRDWYQLGNYKESMNYYGLLLTKDRIQKDKQIQSAILKEFLTVAEKWNLIQQKNNNNNNNISLFSNLSLPTFQDSSIEITSNDLFTIPSSFTQSTWITQMRSNQRMTLDSDINNRLLFDPQPNHYKDQDRNCIVNENIIIRVKIENPLEIELELKQIQLKCRYSKPESAASTNNEENSSNNHDSIGFSVESIELILQPLESRLISLSVTALSVGQLLIEGAQWTIGSSLHGFHPFSLPPRMTHAVGPGGRRRKAEYSIDNSLSIPIVSSMPLLQYSLNQPFPSNIYYSEIIERELILINNNNKISLTKLCCRVSHPGFILFGKPKNNNYNQSNNSMNNNNNHKRNESNPPQPMSPSVIPLTSSSSSSSNNSHQISPLSNCYSYNWSEGLIYFDSITLNPGEIIKIPIYFRATTMGKHQIGLLFRYEPIYNNINTMNNNNNNMNMNNSANSPSNSVDESLLFPMKFRLGYFQFSMNIQSLMNINLFHRPSLQAIEESLLGLEIQRIQIQGGNQQQQQQLVVKSNNNNAINNSSNENNTNASVEITECIAQSRIWKITPSIQNNNNNSASSSQSMISLKSNESAYLFLRISNDPLNRSSSATNQKSINNNNNNKNNNTVPDIPTIQDFAALPMKRWNIKFDNSNNNNNSINNNHNFTNDELSPCSPFSDLLSLEKSLLLDGEKQAIIINPAAKIADCGAADKFDFTIRWKLRNNNNNNNGEYREGLYHLIGISIMKPIPSACALKMFLSYSPTIIHDFNNNMNNNNSSILTVPIQMKIRNILEYNPISFVLELLSSEEEFDSMKRIFRSINPLLLSMNSYNKIFHWNGKTKFIIKQLNPGQELKINLYGNFYSNGIYNLNRFKFIVEINSNPNIGNNNNNNNNNMNSNNNTNNSTNSNINNTNNNNHSMNQHMNRKPRIFFFPLQHIIEIKSSSSSNNSNNNINNVNNINMNNSTTMNENLDFLTNNNNNNNNNHTLSSIIEYDSGNGITNNNEPDLFSSAISSSSSLNNNINNDNNQTDLFSSSNNNDNDIIQSFNQNNITNELDSINELLSSNSHSISSTMPSSSSSLLENNSNNDSMPFSNSLTNNNTNTIINPSTSSSSVSTNFTDAIDFFASPEPPLSPSIDNSSLEKFFNSPGENINNNNNNNNNNSSNVAGEEIIANSAGVTATDPLNAPNADWPGLL